VGMAHDARVSKNWQNVNDIFRCEDEASNVKRTLKDASDSVVSRCCVGGREHLTHTAQGLRGFPEREQHDRTNRERHLSRASQHLWGNTTGAAGTTRHPEPPSASSEEHADTYSGSLFFFMCRVTMRVAKIVVETEAFLVDDVQKACGAVARHSPAHHRSSGIISTARHLFFDSFRLGDRVGLCVAQHGLYNWEKPGLHSFLCAV
jgi:hypothetical protein